MNAKDLIPGKIYKIKIGYGYYFKLLSYRPKYINLSNNSVITSDFDVVYEIKTEWYFIECHDGYRFFKNGRLNSERLKFEEVNESIIEELKSELL